MKTVLVTGGCGFIGSNFVRLLCAHAQWRVINFDKLTYAGNLENLADVSSEQLRFVHGDIRDRKLVEKILQEEKPWAIVNFAAESHVDRSILDASPFIDTNIAGAQNLLDAVRRYPVEKFLHISTDEVYGDKEGQEASAEQAPLAPSSPYAATKAAADLLCFSYQRTYGVPVLITRSSNNYGPYQFPEKLIPLLIRNGLNGMDFPVYGDGRQIRDWLYVEDNCRAILRVLENGRIGSIYNIGTGEERTNLDVIHGLCMALAERLNIDRDQLTERIHFVTDRPGHDRRYAIDTAQIRDEIGWQPRMEFNRGLKQTVNWYLDHADWIAHVTSGAYRLYYDTVYSQSWGRST
ncbi:MAG TPA: dTDP-glucose 4,6-dehydratase [Acidobacteriota bacterium]|nr:dTDP-glucose 4,6-dehydratase [Acidobacteriota bacterium]